MWTNQVISRLSADRVYCRDDLRYALREEKKDIGDSTFRWILYNLEREQKLFRTGYDSYVTTKPKALSVYRPFYTEGCLSLTEAIEKNYPGLSFVMFESVLLNEFLNHQIANNTIFLQVEKDLSSYIFNTLLQDGPGSVLYRPSKKEFERYWKEGCIVVSDLTSQAPLNAKTPHEIVPEKFLVDIVADKNIASTFSPSELPYIYDNFLNSYQVDKHKMNRYAGRRGKSEIVSKYAGGF